jgi:ABC-type amino acid transport substrate-binding protein
MLLGLAVKISTASAACPAKIRMPYNSSWLPYVDVRGQQVTGTDIEFIRTILSQIGSQLRLEPLPESRALKYLAGGQVDLLFAASFTEARADYAWFTTAYRQEKTVLVVHPAVLTNYPAMQTLTAVELYASRLVGAFNPKGYYGPEFEQLKQLPQVKQRTLAIFDPAQRLELVLTRRADFTVVDQTAHRLYVKQHPQYQVLQELPFMLHQADVHLMLSKATISVDCVKLLNQAIQSQLRLQHDLNGDD